MTKDGRWSELPDQISDEMLDAFAAVGTPIETAQQIKDRFGGLIDRTALDASFGAETLEAQKNILQSA